jgi:methyl coenzyme M reductase subunit C-like uncharacterized protein (methanogenesis marker protein 7)
MTGGGRHAKSARGNPPGATQVLGEVGRAAARVRRARENYRAALVLAVDELEHDGARDPYARAAAAAGVSKQAVRELVDRARANRS